MVVSESLKQHDILTLFQLSKSDLAGHLVRVNITSEVFQASGVESKDAEYVGDGLVKVTQGHLIPNPFVQAHYTTDDGGQYEVTLIPDYGLTSVDKSLIFDLMKQCAPSGENGPKVESSNTITLNPKGINMLYDVDVIDGDIDVDDATDDFKENYLDDFNFNVAWKMEIIVSPVNVTRTNIREEIKKQILNKTVTDQKLKLTSKKFGKFEISAKALADLKFNDNVMYQGGKMSLMTNYRKPIQMFIPGYTQLFTIRPKSFTMKQACLPDFSDIKDSVQFNTPAVIEYVLEVTGSDDGGKGINDISLTITDKVSQGSPIKIVKQG